MAKFELYQGHDPLLDYKTVVKKLFSFPHFLTLSFDNICACLSSMSPCCMGSFNGKTKNRFYFNSWSREKEKQQEKIIYASIILEAITCVSVFNYI